MIPTASPHTAAGAGAAPTPDAFAPRPSDDSYGELEKVGNTGSTGIGDDGSTEVVIQTAPLPLPLASAHSPPAVEPLQQPHTTGACANGVVCSVRTLTRILGRVVSAEGFGLANVSFARLVQWYQRI